MMQDHGALITEEPRGLKNLKGGPRVFLDHFVFRGCQRSGFHENGIRDSDFSDVVQECGGAKGIEHFRRDSQTSAKLVAISGYGERMGLGVGVAGFDGGDESLHGIEAQMADLLVEALSPESSAGFGHLKDVAEGRRFFEKSFPKDGSVSTFVLGLFQCGSGATDQFVFGFGATGGAFDDAEAEGDVGGVRGGVGDRLTRTSAKIVGPGDGITGDFVGKGEHELIAQVARQQKSRGTEILECGGEGGEDGVADGRGVAFVPVTEAVQIQ